jgi:hypothetical protein
MLPIAIAKIEAKRAGANPEAKNKGVNNNPPAEKDSYNMNQ